jgi:hypothetical protein
MARATKDDIGDAIDHEIGVWYVEQKGALANVKWPAIPGGDPELFKGAAMINFGVDATKQMFPKSSSTQLLEEMGTAAKNSFAIPLFLVGQAQEQFKKMHQAAIDKANKELSEKFLTLSQDFTRELQRVNRTFLNTKQGRAIADAVYPYVKDIDYKDGRQMAAHLREFIHHGNLVVTDPAVIRDRTTKGLERVSKKLRDAWRGSYHMPWYDNSLMYFSFSKQQYLRANPFTGGGYTTQQWHRLRSKKDQDWVLKNIWRMEVRFIDYHWFWEKDRTDQARITLVNAPDPTTLARPPVKIADADMKKALEKASAQLN